MKMQNHSERGHALLSASGSHRWLNCTASARLEEQFGEKKDTAYAAEGTLAHELAELYISKDVLNSIDDETFNTRLEEIMSNDLFSEEMLDMVPVYVDYVAAQYKEAKANCSIAALEIEQKVDFTEFVPDGFGTTDSNIIGDHVLEVIDLKYGKGVPVYAEWNSQGMLYGLGALRKYDVIYDIDIVRITIVQPRLNNISSFDISVDDLLDWAVTTLEPAAKAAFEGRGELNAGDWCKFCSVKNKCRKLYEQQLEIAKYEFSQANLLSDDEIVDIIKRGPKFIEWINSIIEYAQNKAVKEDKQWPGMKLVEGISRRKWADEDKAVATIFARFPELSEEDIYTMKLKSITDIEKLVGKKVFAERLSDTVVKPQGKPTLVDESDKRPAIGLAQARADFSE